MTQLPELTAVVASAQNDVIGLHGQMPWHLPADLQHFKRLTQGGTVIMGRSTFDSLGRPLPRRRNIVLTRQRDWSATGVDVVRGAEELGAILEEPAFLIGGGQIYAEFWPWVSCLEWTRVHADPQGDTWFRPNLDDFERVATEHHAADASHAFAMDFETWRRSAGG
jgi:dihydrofolate reductase